MAAAPPYLSDQILNIGCLSIVLAENLISAHVLGRKVHQMRQGPRQAGGEGGRQDGKRSSQLTDLAGNMTNTGRPITSFDIQKPIRHNMGWPIINSDYQKPIATTKNEENIFPSQPIHNRSWTGAQETGLVN